ncbi:MAG: hypothetical protein ABGY71_08040 [bacterium]
MNHSPEDALHRLRIAQRLVALLGSLCFSLMLGGTVLYVVRGHTSDVNLVEFAAADPEVKRLAIRQLVSESAGIWDSFPDHEVGRVMLPNIEEFRQNALTVSSNSYGMREREYELPKPEGMVRVVILGDSFIMGAGLNAEDRLGPFLEEQLIQRAEGFTGAIEVINIGLGSWNIQAECAFVRRQLSFLQPDLLVQVVVSNDLDDSSSIRGFGGWSKFSSQHRERAGSLLLQRNPRLDGFKSKNWLAVGLDYESQQRFASAAEDLEQLRDAVRAQGGEYLLLMRWGERLPVADRLLASGIDSGAKTFLPRSFDEDSSFRISAADAHWNRAGNHQVGRMLYGLIRERGLLDALQLGPWEQASRIAKDLHARGSADAQRELDLREMTSSTPITSELRFDSLDDAGAAQIHGGINRKGEVSPYASMILRNRSHSQLLVRGRCPQRMELIEPKVDVFVDEVLLETVSLVPGESFELRAALPAAVAERPYISLRLESSDFIYRGADLRECVAFDIERVALLP